MSQEHNVSESKLNGKAHDSTPNPAFRPRKRRKGKGKKSRRRFTAGYKLRVLQEIDELKSRGHGEVGEILRREGLYTSHISNWRRQRAEGEVVGLSKQRGRKANPDTALRRENKRLQGELERMNRKLAQATAIIQVQKKVSELFQFEPVENNEKS